MKKNNVPQDEGITGGITREVQYAIDENGKYVKTFSKGWEPKNIVNEIAWQDIQEKVKIADKKIKAGKASPLLHFMEKNQMNVSILADYVELSRWRVKKHLKPKGFKKIKQAHLEAYAKIFEITPKELVEFKPEDENKP
ncbi:MAG: helix-turn-helix transcriptional regulator [Bacteroidales bacterium]|jgi:DNA-binding Xre family transcriptional regulator|nr:helix-turn-helix transcriptional regulator [Bacteroidales bacterium]